MDERRIDRFEKYMRLRGLNENQVSTDCGISQGLLGKARTLYKDMSRNVANKILSVYKEINPMWLMYGEGDMLLEKSEQMGAVQMVVDDETVRTLVETNAKLRKMLDDALEHNRILTDRLTDIIASFTTLSSNA